MDSKPSFPSKLRRFFNAFAFSLLLLTLFARLTSFFSFSLGISQPQLNRAAFWLILFAALINWRQIFAFFNAHLADPKQRKKFLLLTGANLLLILIFLVGYAIFQYGSPLVYESHPKSFKAAKEIPLVENTLISQEFTADSNSLGTVGIKLSVQEKILGFNEAGEIVEIKPEEEIEEEKIDQETQEEQLIGQDDLAEEEPLEEIAHYESAEIIFRLKEKGAENWFYESPYFFEQATPSHLFPFGFPIIEGSEGKTYLVELTGKKRPNGETPGLYVFVAADSAGQPYLYSRYVYNKGELKENIGPILENTLRKVSLIFKNQEIILILIVHLVLSSVLITSSLKKRLFNIILQYSFLVFLLSLSIYQFLPGLFSDYNWENSLLKTYLSISTILLGIALFWKNKDKTEAAIIVSLLGGFLLQITQNSANFNMTQPFIVCYSLILVLALSCFVFKNKKEISLSLEKPQEINSKKFFLILSLILLIFTGLCFFQGRIKKTVGGDELHIFNTAIGYLKSGELQQWHWMLDMGFRDYNRSHPVTYLVAYLFKFFGISFLTMRIPSFCAGLLLVVVTALLAKKIFNNSIIALFLALFVSTSPVIIWYATMLRSYIFLMLGTALSYYLFLSFMGDKKTRVIKFFLLLIVFAAMYQIDPHFLIIVPPMLFLISAKLLSDFKNSRRKKKGYLLIFVLLLFVGGILISKGWLLSLGKLYLKIPPSFLKNFSEISFGNLKPVFAVAIVLPILMLLTKKTIKIKMLKYFYISLLLLFFSHLFLLYFLNSREYQIRYVSSVFLINYYVLISALYFLIFHIIPNTKFLKNLFRSKGLFLVVAILAINLSFLFKPFISYSFNKKYPSEFNYVDMYSDGWTTPGRAKPNYDEVNKIIKANLDDNTILIDSGFLYESYYLRDIKIKRDLYFVFCLEDGFGYKNINTICKKPNEPIGLEELLEFINGNKDKKILITWLKRKEYNVPGAIVNFFIKTPNPFIEDLVGRENMKNVNYEIFLIHENRGDIKTQ